MATEPVLDFDALLAPIEGDSPVGEDLREDPSPNSVYFSIKDARTAARASERQQAAEEEASGGPAPEWRDVVAAAPDAIATKSKDLEIACWLTEGLVRVYGFAGARDGFRLIRELVEQYWDGLYPLEDEDGLETKVAPMTGLSGEGPAGTLVAPLKLVPVTAPTSFEPFAAYHVDQANELEALSDPERKQGRIDAGAIQLETIAKAVRETPVEFYTDLVADLDAAIEEFRLLTEAFDNRCGAYGPSTSNIRDTLEAIKASVETITRDVDLPVEKAPADGEAGDAAAGAPGAAAPGAAAAGVAGVAPAFAVSTGGQVIATREDAFKVLLTIAEFFRKTEPHSPMCYTLETLVKRGRMSLADLLAELIPDDEARNNFLLRSGIEPPKEETSSEEGWS